MSALTKGFQILQTVTDSADGMTFSEIVSATGIAKGTAHRLLGEMLDLSVLSFDDASRRYRGGLLLASLGAGVTANYDVRRVARAQLENLHEHTGRVATLGILDGERGIYLDKIEPAGLAIRLHSEVGKSFPLHCTAMGKVLLANADAATQKRVLRRKLEAYTDNTITDTKALRAELDAVTAQGYAIDREEITRGLVCVAAPVIGIDGNVAAAMSCTSLSFDTNAASIKETTQRVLACARAASP